METGNKEPWSTAKGMHQHHRLGICSFLVLASLRCSIIANTFSLYTKKEFFAEGSMPYGSEPGVRLSRWRGLSDKAPCTGEVCPAQVDG